jgi:hypothetical protein
VPGHQRGARIHLLLGLHGAGAGNDGEGPRTDGDAPRLDARRIWVELAGCKLVGLEDANDSLDAGELVELGIRDCPVVPRNAADGLDRAPAEVGRVAEGLDLLLKVTS